MGRARRLADQVLAAGATRADLDGVTRADLDPLAEAGLFGLVGPREAGGLGASRSVQREVVEVLAAADATTTFVWMQHHSSVRLVAAASGALAARWLADLCAGTARAGVAFSHLRQAHDPVRATRVAGGWRLDGRAPWCTGWGVLDVCLVAGASADGQAVFGLVPMRAGAGLTAQPLELAAMAGTQTVALDVDGLVVADGDVALVQPLDRWRAQDTLTTANVVPLAFGPTRAAIRLLADREPATAQVLADRLDVTRSAAYRLLDEVAADEQLDARLDLRAQALLLAVEATTALVAATGGRAMSRTDPAQRLAREALFNLIQAQTPPVRAATLARLRGSGGENAQLGAVHS